MPRVSGLHLQFKRRGDEIGCVFLIDVLIHTGDVTYESLEIVGAHEDQFEHYESIVEGFQVGVERVVQRTAIHSKYQIKHGNPREHLLFQGISVHVDLEFRKVIRALPERVIFVIQLHLRFGHPVLVFVDHLVKAGKTESGKRQALDLFQHPFLDVLDEFIQTYRARDHIQNFFREGYSVDHYIGRRSNVFAV